MNKISINPNTIFPKGQQVIEDSFIGTVYREVLIPSENDLNCRMGNITFEPGARNNWHIHPDGQILLILAGEGYYQEEGKLAQLISTGDVINIPGNVKHWHGATAHTTLEHIAIVVESKDGSTQWLEPVTDEYYNGITSES